MTLSTGEKSGEGDDEMDRKIDETTTENLGPDASAYALRLYKRAAWKLVSDLEMDEDSACEAVWNNGDFMTRAYGILGINPDATTH